MLLSAGTRASDELRGVVVDQTRLALPGVRLDLLDGSVIIRSTTTSGVGEFVFDLPRPGLRVRAALAGFETLTVDATEAGRITMSLASTTETAEVTATVAAADSPTAAASGAQLPQVTAKRLPGVKHSREALPLLPSVIRGPDGLLHIDGVRPHESPLLMDGFDVTDPATGLASIDLPLEAVTGVGILRDPMNITVGGSLGSLAAIETKSGGTTLEGGIEGFVPRPRITGGGFGKLEGFSPRAYIGGSFGRARYLCAGEFDFDRIPVPGVTSRSGSPDTKQVGGTLFARTDFQLSGRDTLSLEGLFVAGHRRQYGLSPLRTMAAALTRFDRDLFGGAANRLTIGKSLLLTLRLSLLVHRAESGPNSTGDAQLTPVGWSGGSFSSLERDATRAHVSLSLQKSVGTARGLHDLTLQTDMENRSLRGNVLETATTVLDASGTIIRSLSFGPPTTIAANDRGGSIAVRDLWRPTSSLQIEGGVRGDFSSLAGWAPSARVGFRYSLGSDGASVLKGGVGTFVGSVPLSAPAFAGFPTRFDKTSNLSADSFSPTEWVLRPSVSGLELPRAFAANLRLERALSPTWDATLGVGLRRASRLATLDVRPDLGLARVASDGRSQYREAEVGLRHTWGDASVFFISYTRSSAVGESNDFSSLFGNGDPEVLQRGEMARLGTDTPHRLLAWSVIDLPAGFGLSPAIEWRSGFPYSIFDATWRYVGGPNRASFPPSFSLNLVVDKKLTFKGQRIKLDVQVFNLTNHFNPRQVFSVLGSPLFGTFTNSVGPTVRGDIAVGW